MTIGNIPLSAMYIFYELICIVTGYICIWCNSSIRINFNYLTFSCLIIILYLFKHPFQYASVYRLLYKSCQINSWNKYFTYIFSRKTTYKHYPKMRIYCKQFLPQLLLILRDMYHFFSDYKINLVQILDSEYLQLYNEITMIELGLTKEQILTKYSEEDYSKAEKALNNR
jgi:hypothetical protein